MSLPWIQRDNLYFVPIIHLRLSGAVLVQRALNQMGLTSVPFNQRDLIAVGLPPSLQPTFREAVAHLPRVSQIIASFSGARYREVYPVTPCDGIVEAVRIASERSPGLPLYFIDREIRPGHLAGRRCSENAYFPDDGLALQFGAARYLEWLRPYLLEPPARVEPVDTWRELHMAQQLRQLQPRFERILVVCDATHVEPVIRMLTAPTRATDEEEQLPDATHFDLEIARPSLDMQLQYLDDIPRLVHRYEVYRRAGKATEFDKCAALLEEILKVERQAGDVRFSTRQYQVFSQFLMNLLDHDGHAAPRFGDVLDACRACFTKAFAERLFARLVGYFTHIKVKRVRWAGRNGDTIHITQRHVRLTETDIFVARFCNPLAQRRFIVGPLNSKEKEQDGGPSHRHFEWPPWLHFVNKMLQKVRHLTLHSSVRGKTAPFRGSLESGIHARRTLHSFWIRQPQIYVFGKRRDRLPRSDPREPVVFLFDPIDRRDCSFLDFLIGPRLGPRYSQAIKYLSVEQIKESTNEGTPLIRHYEILGSAYFCKQSRTVADLKSEYGDELNSRIPAANDMMRHGSVGWLPVFLRESVKMELPWWELLLLAALHYARETVLVVIPNGFSLTPGLISQAAAAGKGKSFRCFSLSKDFSQHERDTLANLYTVALPGENLRDEGEDTSKPAFQQAVADAYQSRMRKYWNT